MHVHLKLNFAIYPVHANIIFCGQKLSSYMLVIRKMFI